MALRLDVYIRSKKLIFTVFVLTYCLKSLLAQNICSIYSYDKFNFIVLITLRVKLANFLNKVYHIRTKEMDRTVIKNNK